MYKSEKRVRAKKNKTTLKVCSQRRKSLILFYPFEFEQNVRNIASAVYSEYPTRRQNEGGFFTFNFYSL